LTFVGISLGLTVRYAILVLRCFLTTFFQLHSSVKWVGLFTIATIGVFTIQQLWAIVTDGTIPLRVFYRHFLARAMALIVVPICVYMFFFRIHFAILNKMGPGSPFMSPEFQATLGGNQLVETYPGKIFWNLSSILKSLISFT
jgi:dolichyl-phosphate-mannose--protein O-mannosyl transferase